LESTSIGSVLEKFAEETRALLLGGFQEDLIDIFKDFIGGLGGIDVVMDPL